MNALDYLLRFPWVEPLGRTLIHFLWQGALIGILAWATLRLARRRSPEGRYALAAGALMLCAACPLGTFLMLAHPWHPGAAGTIPVAAPMAPVAATTPGPMVPAAKPIPVGNLAATAVLPSGHSPGPTTQARVALPYIPPGWRTAAVRWSVLCWMAGVVVLGGRLCIGWIRVQSWQGHARRSDDPELEGRFRGLADRMGIRADRVRLLVSEALSLPGPLAAGVFRPAVLLPAKVLARLPLAQIEALLAHELGHIRRHDYLWNLLASALEVALFYHPAVWFLGRELRAAREECCDALAAGVCPDRLVYARALAAVAEWRQDAAFGVPAPAAAHGPLVGRFRRLLGLDVPPEPLLTGRNAGWALALAGVVLAAMAILYSGKLMAQGDEAQDPTVPVLVRPAPHGSVVDATGRPVPGARVRLVQIRSHWSPDNGVVEETTADAGGRFIMAKPVRFHHPDAFRDTAEYTLLADVPGLAPGWVTLSPDDAENPDRRLTLTAPTHKHFVVTDRAGKPIPGAVVEMRGAFPRDKNKNPLFQDSLLLPADMGLRRAVTDEAGHTTVEGLPDTMIHFVTSREGFGDNTGYESDLASVTQTIPLQVASVLKGRVTDPLGRPVAGATVSLYPEFRYHTFFEAKTDADGRYCVTGIWSDREANRNWKDWGKYEVAVRHPRFTATAREVTFEGRQTITDFDLAAVPGTELVGHLHDPQTQSPVVDAAVQVDSPSGRQTFFTGTDGSFHGRVMPGKIYAFFWQPPRNRFVEDGRAGGQPTNLQAQASGERFPVDLYTPGPVGRVGTVRGQVNTPDGQPVAGCRVDASLLGFVQIGGWRSNGPRAVVTDEAGRFVMRQFPIGPDMTLSIKTKDNTATATRAVTLEGDALDLPTPIVLQPTTAGGEFLLTDRHGQPRANLAVSVGPVRAGQNYPVQDQNFQSDASGILRVPHVIPGARYAVTLVDSDRVTRVVNNFDAPREIGGPPPPRRTLVIDPEGLVRLLGSDDRPLPIKRIVEYGGSSVIYGRRSRWMNELPILRREGTDLVVPWKNAVGDRGEPVYLLVETDDGNYARAEGPLPLDGSNLIVVRATAVMRPDTTPDPTVPDVAADTFAGRVVDPDGKPVAGAAVDMPGVHFRQENVPPILTGEDGVFRIPKPPYRFSYLTVAKEGWATAFLIDVQPGQGFRVTLRNDTHLRGTIGGENPGRVALILRTNKFTRNDDSLDHEVSDVEQRQTTDEHGGYDFPVEPGRYHWDASSADGRFASGEVSVEPGRAADLRAALHPGYDLDFDLVDCQSGQPVPGIEVSIYEPQTDRSYSARPGSAHTSDAAGRVHWENLPPGKKQFASDRMQRAEQGSDPKPQSPYARWWRADEPRDWRRVDYAKAPPTGQDHASWIELDVQPGLPPQRILLERGVKITGQVVGADGRGVPGADIVAIEAQNRELSNFSAQTDQAGNFLAYLPAGNGVAYHLCAYTFPDGDKPAPGTPAISEPFQSRPGDERTFRLAMGKGGWFTGRLVTADGKPAAGFRVTAMAEDELEVRFAARIAVAGADGRFRLGPLRPGKYRVYPGTGAGAPIRELPGAAKTRGEIAGADDEKSLGDLALPAGAQRQD